MPDLAASRKLRVSLPDQKLLAALEPSDGVELLLWDLTGPAPADPLDMVVPPYMGGAAALAALDSVEVGLVQSQSIGYDGVAPRFCPPGAFSPMPRVSMRRRRRSLRWA